jgi:DNA-binding transcriptional MerR regulator
MHGKNQIGSGHLAKATGTTVVTVRYYEQIGLLPLPSRTAANYRTYSHEHMRRLRFIRHCRDLGFTLDQIHDPLRLSSRKDEERAEVDRITAQRIGVYTSQQTSNARFTKSGF